MTNNYRKRRYSIKKQNNFGVIYEVLFNTPKEDTKEIYKTKDKFGFPVVFPTKINIKDYLGTGTKGWKQNVYEFTFDRPFYFIYTDNTCGWDAETEDALSLNYNKKLFHKNIEKIYNPIYNIDNENVKAIFKPKNNYFNQPIVNKFTIAHHEGGSCYLYLGTESTDVPGKDIQEYIG